MPRVGDRFFHQEAIGAFLLLEVAMNGKKACVVRYVNGTKKNDKISSCSTQLHEIRSVFDVSKEIFYSFRA